MPNTSTYDHELDAERLDKQHDRVEAVLLDAQKPLTLGEIQDAIRERFGLRDPEASISARIRDLRAEYRKKGGDVLGERRGDPRSGCWEYRIKVGEDVA